MRSSRANAEVERLDVRDCPARNLIDWLPLEIAGLVVQLVKVARIGREGLVVRLDVLDELLRCGVVGLRASAEYVESD